MRDQPFIGKRIVIKTELLGFCIHLNYSSSGEYAGEPSWDMSEKVAAKISVDEM